MRMSFSIQRAVLAPPNLPAMAILLQLLTLPQKAVRSQLAVVGILSQLRVIFENDEADFPRFGWQQMPRTAVI